MARASQDLPTQPSPMMVLCWNVEGMGEVGSRRALWGPGEALSSGGGHQSDRLVTIGEGSDEREPYGMQKNLTISQETWTSR